MRSLTFTFVVLACTSLLICGTVVRQPDPASGDKRQQPKAQYGVGDTFRIGNSEAFGDPQTGESGNGDSTDGVRGGSEQESPSDLSRDYRPKRSPWRRKPLPRRSEFPSWKNQPGFGTDLFTFVRIQYDAYGSFGWWDRWDNDYPDGDWNFSWRLQQLTSLRVNPNGKVLRLTDPELFNYPFIYMAGVQKMILSESEQQALRRYLLNGGFVMMDDFWAPTGWENVHREMRKVFPDRQPVELTIKHPIFQYVYPLKELPQVVDLKTWSDGFDFEYWHGYSDGDEAPHFWAYFDDGGRMVAILCHNNDVGDGWEREGENVEYFREFSEKKSYPLGINIITYAMTH